MVRPENHFAEELGRYLNEHEDYELDQEEKEKYALDLYKEALDDPKLFAEFEKDYEVFDENDEAETHRRLWEACKHKAGVEE